MLFRLTIVVIAFTVCPLETAAAAANAPRVVAGRSRQTFTARHPLSSLEEVCRRIDVKPEVYAHAGRVKPTYDLADESFEVFAPPTYKPGVPHGLLVWISAGEAELPPAWFPVFARHKLIWVSANNTGNRRDGAIRMGLALDAVHNMTNRYDIDPERVYISGFSAGGALATLFARTFPDVFRGGYSLMGGYFYQNRKTKAGAWEPTVTPDEPSWRVLPVGRFERLRKELKFVILRGERDPQFSAAEGLADHQALTLDGFERVSFIEVPRTGHEYPNVAWFEKGIAALEAPPKKPPTTRPTGPERPLPGQVGQAQRILSTALRELDGRAEEATRYPGSAARREKEARKYLEQVLKDYPTTPAAGEARELITELDGPRPPPKTD